MKPTSWTRADFDHSPMLVFYEVTRACDLLCKHCRADAQSERDPSELSTEQAERLIGQLATFPKPPLLVLTGGDPLKRRDVYGLIRHAVAGGLEVAMTPSATPLADVVAIAGLKEAGLRRLAVSLDGFDPATHDGFRRVPGSFDRTMRMISDARAIGLPVQINTTVGRHNVDQLDAIADLLACLDIVLWSVFFLIPVGRGMAEQRLTAEECEGVFAKLHAHSKYKPYSIKTTEAPHYRRFLIQQKKSAAAGKAFAGTNDGRGVMFVSHTGEIFPSGFLPVCCGQFPLDSVVHVYQKAALFRALRDTSRLGGKCGRCEFKEICGGSRARAYAMTGDPLGEEPDCAYAPFRQRG